ncbi:MAG: PIN domain-containing protein [Bacteroidales bacterium]|jgi:predicted nucleic-acid-binding protein|nr:PIN domain-containing protein [Bacteroidales bacterium]
MLLLDTNAILRYILQDNQTMADSVEEQLLHTTCYIPVEVIAEVVYVLLKVYNVGRTVIAETLHDIADTANIIVAKDLVVRHALTVFATSTFDFVDCLLIGYSKKEQYSVFTFDKKLQKYV